MANLFVRVLIFVLCENFSYQTETLELLEMLLNIGLIYLNSLSKSGSKARIRNTYNFILISISNQDPLAAFHSQAEQSFLNSKSNHVRRLHFPAFLVSQNIERSSLRDDVTSKKKGRRRKSTRRAYTTIRKAIVGEKPFFLCATFSNCSPLHRNNDTEGTTRRFARGIVHRNSWSKKLENYR